MITLGMKVDLTQVGNPLAKIINLEFEGYWREVSKTVVPEKSGVYLVYVGRYNESNDKVFLDKLIYIGEAENVNDRIQAHDKEGCWRKQVVSGSELLFSFAPIAGQDRERAEAALIFAHKPVCNDQYTDSFPFEDTTVNSTGRCALIRPSFTIAKRTT